MCIRDRCCILLLAGVFLYTSFAVFTEEKEFNVINGQYQDPGDLYFAVYIDGEITNTFPSKDCLLYTSRAYYEMVKKRK